jgi:hypothetical protein
MVWLTVAQIRLRLPLAVVDPSVMAVAQLSMPLEPTLMSR